MPRKMQSRKTKRKISRRKITRRKITRMKGGRPVGGWFSSFVRQHSVYLSKAKVNATILGDNFGKKILLINSPEFIKSVDEISPDHQPTTTIGVENFVNLVLAPLGLNKRAMMTIKKILMKSISGEWQYVEKSGAWIPIDKISAEAVTYQEEGLWPGVASTSAAGPGEDAGAAGPCSWPWTGCATGAPAGTDQLTQSIQQFLEAAGPCSWPWPGCAADDGDTKAGR